MKASRPHDQAMVELLREDPLLANEYLAECLRTVDEPGGRVGLLAALRQIAAEQGFEAVAKRAGIQRETLRKALSAQGNPTLKTLLAILKGAGLRLAVTPTDRHDQTTLIMPHEREREELRPWQERELGSVGKNGMSSKSFAEDNADYGKR